MAITVAELIGTPVYADYKDLDHAIETGNKATTASSRIAEGKVALLQTGKWVIGASGGTGRAGVVPRLHPFNQDSSPTLNVVTGKDAEIFVEVGTGPINPGDDVVPDALGKVKAGTPGFAYYTGHDGEGSHGNPVTTAQTGDGIKIKLRGAT